VALRIPGLASIAVVALALASACAGGGSNEPSDVATFAPGATGSICGDGGEGALLVTLPLGLVECDLDTGTTTPIITPTEANTFILDPAISPDARLIAYVRQPPPEIVEGRYDAGADLWVANRDGSEPRIVFEHAQPNQLVRFPQWQDDANVLAIVQEISMEGGLTTVVYTLQRINIESGERTRLLDDVLSFTVAPDGERVAYARLSRPFGETFAAVNLDGSDDVTLVDPSENLAPFNFPRYSPDGGVGCAGNVGPDRPRRARQPAARWPATGHLDG
jgi:hypothetical protein